MEPRTRQIDALCDAFEEGWQGDRPALLEEIVRAADAPLREELFQELLAIEWEYRAKAGRPLAVAEARERFAVLGPWTAAAILDILADTKSWSKPARAAAPGGRPAARYVVGQYELLARLGRGSFGTVFKAKHLALKRLVAVKLLHAHRVDTADGVARFRRETEALGRLDHAHVVRATDAGEADGYSYVAMEYVEGADLNRVLAAGRPAVADACEAIRQAADGLAYIERCGLVHRDIKPSNLLLGRDGVVRILDLGLARLTGPDAERFTHSGVVMGSADYISPEQARESRDVDIRSDVYSLGCTLYALLAGAAPFADPKYDSVYDKFRAHNEAPVPPLAARRPDAPPELIALIERMLEKQPGKRPRSPAEVGRDLAPFCDGHDLAGLIARVVPVAAGDGAVPPLPASEIATSLPTATDATTRTFAGPRAGRRWRGRGAALAVVLLAGIGFFAVSGRFGPAQDGGADAVSVRPPVPPAPPTQGANPVPAEPPPPRVFKPGEWVELLDRPPVVRAWPNPADGSEWTWRPEKKSLLVDCRDRAMFECGTVGDWPHGYDLEATVSQNPWTGGVGLIYRGRPEKSGADDALVADCCSLLAFLPNVSTDAGFLRGQLQASRASGRATVTQFRVFDIPRPNQPQYRIAVFVPPNGMGRFTLGEQVIEEEPLRKEFQRFELAGTAGAVGVSVASTTVQVHSVRIRLRNP